MEISLENLYVDTGALRAICQFHNSAQSFVFFSQIVTE